MSGGAAGAPGGGAGGIPAAGSGGSGTNETPDDGGPCSMKDSSGPDTLGQPCICNGTKWSCTPKSGEPCATFGTKKYGNQVCTCYPTMGLACTDESGKSGLCAALCSPPKENLSLCEPALPGESRACTCEGIPAAWKCNEP